ncbi:XRE family transcriptional regulator [Acinetobacter courvalinii]|uniref:LexA family protein n=1 Tax=Acinetobacter courvalinii TaxID=280147 RepID=UPI0021CD4C51|nr:XRE family transcriptional regulator [Acinetobacter courvalinii]MCU4389984.1 XRE family transcriptional regulator [Acinetobacter courvalinii]
MKKLETMGQRIRSLRREKNLTQGDLAKIVGVSAPNVTGWEKDAYAPKADPLSKMASYFGVSTSYITNGDESGPKLDNNVVPVNQKLIPVLSWVQAGAMTSVEQIDPHKINEWLPSLSADDPDGCFYLRVVGVSNFPTYMEGDYILVNPNYQVCDLLSEDLIVVRKDSEATFKKLVIESNGHKYLQALNPNFHPNIIEFEEGTVLVGLVIDAFRPLGGSRPKRVRKS